MNSVHCTMALLNLKFLVDQYGKPDYMFYSRKYVKDGIEGGWSLPIGSISGELLEDKLFIDF